MIMPRKGEYAKFKNHERKIKPPLIIYADFESILVPQSSRFSKNLKIYQKHIACSYGYKLVCIGDKFSKPFKIYLGENVVY